MIVDGAEEMMQAISSVPQHHTHTHPISFTTHTHTHTSQPPTEVSSVPRHRTCDGFGDLGSGQFEAKASAIAASAISPEERSGQFSSREAAAFRVWAQPAHLRGQRDDVHTAVNGGP